MDWNDLKELVNQWHEKASQIEGYQDTTPAGDGIQLVLLANRTKDGQVRLTAMAVKDLFSMISPAEMLQPQDAPEMNNPSIPIATKLKPR